MGFESGKGSAFYEGLFEVLGWNQSGENGFKLGDTKIYFREHQDLSIQKSFGPRHICFLADNRAIVDQVGEYLKECKARIIRGPLEVEEDHYSKGYYTVDFFDPNGYILEVAHSSKGV